MMNGGLHPGSRTGSSSSPDSCSNGDLDEDLEAACCNSSVNGSLSVAMQPGELTNDFVVKVTFVNISDIRLVKKIHEFIVPPA